MSERVAVLDDALREALELYNAAEVVGPTREEIRRIAEIGRLLDPPWIPSWERPASDSLGVQVVMMTDSPLLVPHAFDDSRPDIWGSKCRLCGCTSAHQLHEPPNARHDPGDEDRR